MTIRGIKEMFPEKPKVGNYERLFEIRLMDYTTKNIYKMDCSFKIAEMYKNPMIIRENLIEAFDKMVVALFRSGTLPMISTEIVDSVTPKTDTQKV